MNTNTVLGFLIALTSVSTAFAIYEHKKYMESLKALDVGRRVLELTNQYLLARAKKSEQQQETTEE